MLNSNSMQQVSRQDLKKQLQGIESFDISSFGQSKNQASTNIRGLIHSTNNQSLFPVISAPTLQLLQDSQYNIRYLDKLQTKPKQKPKKKQHKNHNHYYQDLTARNSQAANTYHYEEKIQEMEKHLDKMHQKLQGERKEKQLLHEKINLLEIRNNKVVEDLKDKNRELKEQLKLVKEREIKTFREKELLEKQFTKATENKTYGSRESRAASITSSGNSIHSSTVHMTSYMEDPSYFCPELLSPQQTVILLSKLLKKVSKSSKMIKQLTDDQSVKTILNKIQKK